MYSIIIYSFDNAYYDICTILPMVEGIIIGFSEMLSIAQTIGLVGTMVLTLFFSKTHTESVNS